MRSIVSWNVFTMNQKMLPISRRKLRSISTISSGPGIVRRASALGMDETLPHFAQGKRANLLSVAAVCSRFPVGSASVRMFEARALRRPQGDGYRRPCALDQNASTFWEARR
jgi:hypothetical protein